MSHIKPHTRGGGHSLAYVEYNTTDSASADNGIEVDDSESGAHIEKMRFDLREYGSLQLNVWAESFALDVIMQELVGYNAAGAEVWKDIGLETALTAAASDTVAAVLAVTVEIIDGDVSAGIYRLAAQRAGATAAGRLHIHGHAKAS